MTEPLVPSYTEAAKDFCRILGLDPGKVGNIRIEMPAGRLMTYRVFGFVTVGQVQEMNAVLRRYALVPKEKSQCPAED